MPPVTRAVMLLRDHRVLMSLMTMFLSAIANLFSLFSLSCGPVSKKDEAYPDISMSISYSILILYFKTRFEMVIE